MANNFDFNELNYFNLDARREQLACELYGSLKVVLATVVASESYDESVLDALTYELLRQCIIRPDEYSSSNTHRKSLKSSRQYQAAPKSVAKLLSKNNFDALVSAADHFGFSDQFINEFTLFRELLTGDEFRIRREVHSSNINFRTQHIGSIPVWVTPPKLRDTLFFFRWSLILAYSHNLYRKNSIDLYTKVRNHLIERRSEFELHGDKYKVTRLRMILECLPVVSDRSTIEKSISEFLNMPWAIEFMHSDYAGLLKWDVICQMPHRPFLAKFVSDVLGRHILEARLVKKWTNRSIEWKKHLKNRGKILPRLKEISSEVGRLDQAIQVDGFYNSFDYLPKLDPRYPTNRGLIQHAPLELCTGVFPSVLGDVYNLKK